MKSILPIRFNQQSPWGLIVMSSVVSAASSPPTPYFRSSGDAVGSARGNLGAYPDYYWYDGNSVGPNGYGFSQAASASANGHENKFETGAVLPWPWEYSAFVTDVNVKFAFHTATCYLKVWWDIVDIINSVTSVVSSDNWEWDADGANGFCLPPGHQSTDDPGQWWVSPDAINIQSSSPSITQPPGTPGGSASVSGSAQRQMANIRCSVLRGYEPPSPNDPAANGYPA